jgi:hypothetical protein
MEWYADTGTSMDPIFDKRVALTFKAFDVALEYVLNGRLVGPAAAQNNVESQEFDGVKNSWGDSTARWVKILGVTALADTAFILLTAFTLRTVVLPYWWVLDMPKG